MGETLDLHDSEVAAVTVDEGTVSIELSSAYVRAGGDGWSQGVRIHLEDAQVLRAPAGYPATLYDGTLESDYERFENFLPVPLARPERFTLRMLFTNGEQLRIAGHNPTIELIRSDRLIRQVVIAGG